MDVPVYVYKVPTGRDKIAFVFSFDDPDGTRWRVGTLTAPDGSRLEKSATGPTRIAVARTRIGEFVVMGAGDAVAEAKAGNYGLSVVKTGLTRGDGHGDV